MFYLPFQLLASLTHPRSRKDFKSIFKNDFSWPNNGQKSTNFQLHLMLNQLGNCIFLKLFIFATLTAQQIQKWRTCLCFIIRDVDNTHEDVLLLLQLVVVEEVDHDLGDERDRDQGQYHGHGPEGEQLGAKCSPSLLLGFPKLKYS